jgi:hypothetical protein
MPPTNEPPKPGSPYVKGYQMPTADTRRVQRTWTDQLAVGVPVTPVGGRRLISLGGGNRGREPAERAGSGAYGDLNEGGR